MLALVAFAVEADAQKMEAKDVPAAVTVAFAQSHPLVTNVEWTRGDGNYLAGYRTGNKDFAQLYNASGALIETRAEIAFTSMPATAIEYVYKHCADDKCVYDAAEKAYRISDQFGSVTYQAQVKDKVLRFDSNGNLVKN